MLIQSNFLIAVRVRSRFREHVARSQSLARVPSAACVPVRQVCAHSHGNKPDGEDQSPR
jgi:hypothetical protein